uniref:hypothetical protein n=1 Tax=Drechslerella dactyloides TaxID=74499 RepID=UPI0022FD6BBB
KLGKSVWLRFILSQHNRDEVIINNLMKYLNCGKYYTGSNKNYGELIVEKFSDILEKIIPFFDKYSLVWKKSKDYQDFKKVALMKSKAHLTEEVLQEIKKIKSGMNSLREHSKYHENEI